MKKIISGILICLVLNLTFYVSTANGNTNSKDAAKRAKIISKLKAELNKIGIGKESKVEVKLNDGTKISGYLAEINEEDFAVTQSDDETKRVRYDRVRKAKGRYGHRRFAMTTSILGAVLGILLIALSNNPDTNY
ncbi:MAG: hypothetical protein LUM44_16895 [Pyrinomonadaceae bacterium]|nr:hypothetical protein [Pyrinomonadaceae bacterium]